MEQYFYDLHCHTINSIDSITKLESLVKSAKKRGLDGIAITDHSKTYTGPLEIDGIEIIPGNELTLKGGGHLLLYFIKEEMPQGLTLEEAVSMAKDQGGFAVLAHPFRNEHGWIKGNLNNPQKLRRGLEAVDGLESGNASDSQEIRDMTIKMKEDNSGIPLILTAGSDSHMPAQVGFSAIKVNQRLTKDNFSTVLINGEIIVRPESERFRKEINLFKKYVSLVGRIAMIDKSRKMKDIFLNIFVRNYFRVQNITLSRINFNYKK